MALRRIYFLFCVFAGVLACGVTLVRTLLLDADVWNASLHAVGAGMATMLIAMLFLGFIQRLGEEKRPPTGDKTE